MSSLTSPYMNNAEVRLQGRKAYSLTCPLVLRPRPRGNRGLAALLHRPLAAWVSSSRKTWMSSSKTACLTAQDPCAQGRSVKQGKSAGRVASPLVDHEEGRHGSLGGSTAQRTLSSGSQSGNHRPEWWVRGPSRRVGLARNRTLSRASDLAGLGLEPR